MGPRTMPAPLRRPVIVDAWRRAEMSGLTPDSAPAQLPVETDPDSRLLRAARPVLAEAEPQLSGTGIALVLVDRDARIVYRHLGSARLERHLEGIGVLPGARFSEDLTGTNSIATSYELHRGVSVLGEEHFLEELRRYSCYGQPVFDPLTRRLEGVLDITCNAPDASPVFGPYLSQLCRQIETRLLGDARVAQRRVLAAYQAASSPDRGQAVLAIGADLVMANEAATRRLSSEDIEVLRVLASSGCASASTRFTGSTGHALVADVVPVEGADGAVFTLRSAALQMISTVPALRPAPVAPSLWIAGEPGTGRSREAAAVAAEPGEPAGLGQHAVPGARPAVHDALDVPEVGVRGWLAVVVADLARPGVVVLENLDVLDDAALHRLRVAVASAGPGTRVVATATGVGEPGTELAALASAFGDQRVLPPLREDRARLPSLAEDLLAEVAPGRDLRLAPALVAWVAAAPWPGNVTELRAVLTHLAGVVSGARVSRTLVVADLPPRYRGSAAGRSLGPLERAERDTIVAALHRAGGNKVKAARTLGIARATLYNRLRVLRIDA